MQSPTRQLAAHLKLAATIWIAAEVIVFAVVVHFVGIGWALLAGVASTLLGASLLKRAGAAAVMRLRGTLQGRHDGRPEDVLDGTIAALAAAALILPGFLSDAAGLVLSVPAVRGRAARWVRGGGLGVGFEAKRSGASPQTIDLDRGEWSRTRPPGQGGSLP